MSKTQVRPARDLRNNYADIVKTLKQHDHVIITNNGVGESVLINFDDFSDYQEYLHHRFIYDELQKSKDGANDQSLRLIAATDVFARIEQRIKARGL
jgi:PHD/YefM family antitoxin component YafN of YafNO toxin-antitoxin module